MHRKLTTLFLARELPVITICPVIVGRKLQVMVPSNVNIQLIVQHGLSSGRVEHPYMLLSVRERGEAGTRE